MADYHIIKDYETLGENSWECVAVNMSLLVFDWDRFLTNPYTFEELVADVEFYKFDVNEQVEEYNRKISKGTLDWWQRQDKEVRKQIIPSDEDVSVYSIYETFDRLSRQYGKWTTVWSRGQDFDIIVTKTILQSMGKNYNDMFVFSKPRDIRTFLDTLTNFDRNFKHNFIPPGCEDVEFEAHNSIHDIAMDVMRMQFMVRLIFSEEE